MWNIKTATRETNGQYERRMGRRNRGKKKREDYFFET